MVPFSSPTALDKQEEVRKLNIEIAGLSQTLDTTRQRTQEAENAAQDAERRVQDATHLLESLEASLEGVGGATHAFLEESRRSIQKASESVTQAIGVLKKLSERITALEDEISALGTRKDEVLAEIAREQELMSAQRADLDIYHARIVSAAEKYLPGQQIIIPNF